MAQDWFEQNAPKAKKAAQTGGDWFTQNAPKAAAAVAVPDFSANPKKEGVYQMVAPDVSTAGREYKTVSIPYSNVMAASQAGWRIRPEDRETYAKDRRAEVMKGRPFVWDEGWFTDKTPEGGISEQNYLKAMQLPEAVPVKPGMMGRVVHSVEQGVQKATEPTTKYPGMPQPFTKAGRKSGLELDANVVKRVGRVLFGIPDMVPQAFSALSDSLSHDPQKAADGYDRFTKMVNPTAQIMSRWKELKDDFHRDPKLAASNIGGDLIGIWLAGKAMEIPKGVTKLGGAAKARVASKYAPDSVTIAGVDVPVGVGEQLSFTKAGREFIRLKRKGVGREGEFESFERRQQGAVKEVIRNTARQTSGFIGPMEEAKYLQEPGAAMKDASEITFDRARPMYRALDTAAVSVPDTFAKAGKITQTAIARARKLGVEIDTEPRWVDAKDNPVDPGQLPLTKAEMDARVKAALSEPLTKAEIAVRKKAGQPVGDPLNFAEVDAREKAALSDPLNQAEIAAREAAGELSYVSPATHPLTAFMKVRSQLLKMQRLSKDPAVSYQIGQEIKTLNAAMDGALKGTPLHENWREASRLWAKGYALRTMAREIGMITKGTPTEVQMQAVDRHLKAGERAVVMPEPTRLQGASLVNRLNKLAESGDLEKAFTPEEVQNLRESANLLERIQKTRVGRTAERTHGLGHVLGLGAKGSASLGAVAGWMHGGLLGAAIGAAGGGAAMGGFGWVAELYENALAKVMTTTDGVEALRAIDAAKTPGQLQVATKALAQAIAASVAAQQKPTKNAKELNAEAARLAGATPAAMPSQPPSAPAAPIKPSAVHPVLSSPAINRAAKASGVSPNLLRAVTEQESGGKAGAVSVKGATGVMQLMPATAKKYGVTDATDPEQNLMAGAQYLRDLLDKHHGDITEALKDYYGRGTPPPGYPSADKYAQAVLGRFKSLSAPQSQTAAQSKKGPRELDEEARRLAGLSGAVYTGTSTGADSPQ